MRCQLEGARLWAPRTIEEVDLIRNQGLTDQKLWIRKLRIPDSKSLGPTPTYSMFPVRILCTCHNFSLHVHSAPVSQTLLQ